MKQNGLTGELMPNLLLAPCCSHFIGRDGVRSERWFGFARQVLQLTTVNTINYGLAAVIVAVYIAGGVSGAHIIRPSPLLWLSPFLGQS
ncbi:MAG: hypothetical protein H6661_07040 [Ardenticatenaceae bacterium]|nr:hypothetical protein [Ardenticatenaceae bacterium]